MKALTIWQPWATLIAHGHKQYETRSWPPPVELHGRMLAIHAAKADPEPLPTYDLLDDDLELPLGKVVAVATLSASFRCGSGMMPVSISPKEWELGDFSPSRYAWRLDGVIALPEPVPCRGYQRIWQVPEAAALAILDQLP